MHPHAQRNGATRAVAAALALTIVGATLAGCAERGTRLFEQRLYSMGTWVDVTIGAESERLAAAAIADVESMLRRFEVDYYAWADGELARVNETLRDGREAEVGEELAALLVEARRLAAASGGAFEPGVGELVEMWGFHTAPAADASDPAPGAIEEWRRSAVRIEGLSIDAGLVRANGRRVKLDLGGIAKGEAVDRAIELLRRHGIRDALVNAGGDVRVIGTNRQRPWRIGIQAPRGEGLLGVIELADGEAAFTSGDYERFFERDGVRRHHILDPRTGYPVTDTQAVTVVAATGVDADAAATAVFVAGENDWRHTAAAMGIDAALRVGTDGTVQTTSIMRERLASRGPERTDVAADS
jgi:FAD:protein FMN transferase